jgi:peptidoglycan hydrolase-like protein with peptidoglycan-binding domain
MILRKGTIAQEVAFWQKFLAEKEFLTGTIDGIFGEQTKKATIAWQKASGLDDDGVVGAGSFAKAKEQGYAHAPETPWYPPRPDFDSPSTARVKELFGEFQFNRLSGGNIQILGTWVADNIVKVEIPQIAGIEGAPADGKIRFHRKGADQLKGLFDEIERQGFKDLLISFAGTFVPRMVRGSTSRLSNHSWGTAFDINAPENWLGQQPAPVGRKGSLLKIVPIANSFGFYWGGHYNNRPDGMHFELAVLDRFPD